MSEIRLKQVITDWREYGFEQQPVLQQTFTAGLNHSAFLLSSRGKCYVLKIFSTPSKSAIAAQQWAANLKLAPNVLFVNKQHDLMTMEYIETPTLGLALLRTSELTELGNSLRRLHSSPSESLQTKLGNFDFLVFCERYLQGLDTKIHHTHQTLLPTLNAFVNDDTPWTLCHNDLVKENCFVSNNTALFIDWEYAQFHNPWFDLAAIILYLELTPEQANLFLEAYETGWGAKVGSHIYYTSQSALLWGDMLWHLAKFGMDYSSSMQRKWNKLKLITGKLKITIT